MGRELEHVRCQSHELETYKNYFVYGKIRNAYGVDDDDLMCERIDPLKTCRRHKTLITLTLWLDDAADVLLVVYIGRVGLTPK